MSQEHIINTKTDRCVRCSRNAFNRNLHPICDHTDPLAIQECDVATTDRGFLYRIPMTEAEMVVHQSWSNANRKGLYQYFPVAPGPYNRESVVAALYFYPDLEALEKTISIILDRKKEPTE